jgi:hypothetical protein
MLFPYPSLRQRLVGAWCPSFGATGYTLVDRSGRNNNGTLNNMDGQQNWVASGTGTALRFDGTNDYVACGSVPILGAAPRTLSHWFLTTASADANWVSFGANAVGQLWQTGIYIGSLGALNYSADVTTSATPYRDGKWHHIATLYDGVSVILYIDGNRIGSGVFTINTGASQLNIGRAITAANYSSVLLDDVRIYSRALTAAEVKLLASRRGVGLTPIGSTRATYPTKFQIRVAGTWREADAYQNVAGVWKPSPPSIKVAGVWK